MSDSPLRPEKERPETEHEGPLWKHPYFLYIILTAALFLLLVGAAWLAVTQDWIPHR